MYILMALIILIASLGGCDTPKIGIEHTQYLGGDSMGVFATKHQSQSTGLELRWYYEKFGEIDNTEMQFQIGKQEGVIMQVGASIYSRYGQKDESFGISPVIRIGYEGEYTSIVLEEKVSEEQNYVTIGFLFPLSSKNE